MLKTFGTRQLIGAVCCLLLGSGCIKTVDGELDLEAEDTNAAQTDLSVPTDTEIETETEATEQVPEDEATEVPREETDLMETDEGNGEDAADASVEQPIETDEEETDPDAGSPATSEVSEEEDGVLLDAGWIDMNDCVFESEPVPFSLPPDALPDAGPPQAPHVLLANSAFLGSYLTDGQGYALYIYTADLPGDCNNPPVSTCVDDCLLAWPVFEAWDRQLGEGLEDVGFGTFVRDDGVQQTTYQGWPLYYYAKDESAGTTGGQGKGSIWYLAEQSLPNLVIMRAPQELEGVKYLADGRGYTLYSYEGDDIGNGNAAPRVNCVGECSKNFRPFSVKSLQAVSKLEPADLSQFVQGQGSNQQVSYRGQPLYLSKHDEKSGEMNGLEHEGFSLVEP